MQTERQKIFTAKDDGSITAIEFELACLEIDRRLLALSRQSDSQNVPDNVSRPLAWMIGIILPALTLAIYLAIGSPQSPDRPYASRSTEIAAAKSRAAANETAGASALRAAINASERAPRDVEKWLQLAQAAANVGDVETEIRALRTALGLTNQDPSIMSMLAESLSRAADGQVTVPARELIKTVLAANPDEPRALFLAGLAHFQDGAYVDAISSWQRLLTISQPNAPWVTLVRENIARAAEAGDIKLADQGPGPDAAAIADAASMTEDERKAMIDDDVEQRIQQGIAPAVAEPARVFAQALAHRVEGIEPSLVKADDEAVLQEQTDLLGPDRPVRCLRKRCHDEKLPVVGVDFRALAGVVHVLEGESVQAERRTELA